MFDLMYVELFFLKVFLFPQCLKYILICLYQIYSDKFSTNIIIDDKSHDICIMNGENKGGMEEKGKQTENRFLLESTCLRYVS